jgi:hypothetical protein
MYPNSNPSVFFFNPRLLLSGAPIHRSSEIKAMLSYSRLKPILERVAFCGRSAGKALARVNRYPPGPITGWIMLAPGNVAAWDVVVEA